MTPIPRLGRGALLALAAGSLAAGCAAAVPGEQVESSIIDELRRLGVAGEQVACSGHLTAVVGETIRCTFTVDGQTVDAVATVVEVESGKARYDIVTAARPVAETLMERRLATEVPRRGGGTGNVDCPGELPAAVGGSLLCSVENGRSVRVTVTSVTGGEVRYSVVAS